MVRICLLICMLLSTGSLFAANITVTPSHNPVAIDETFNIAFKVEGQQDGEPDFSPLNKDFQLMGTSQSSAYSIANGRTSSSKTYTLTVAALRQGKIDIPPIHFGKDKSEAITITVKDAGYRPPGTANGPQSAPSAVQDNTDLLFITTDTDTQTPYVQQQVILTVKIYRRLRWAEASLSDPGFVGVETMYQQLGKEKNYETEKDGKRYAVTELRYALFPQKSGKLTIKPFVLRAKVASGNSRRAAPGGFGNPFFDDFFNRQTYTTKVARSQAQDIDVKPIPVSFTGKHWIVAKDLQLQENWSGDTAQLQAGEPVTRTLALIGDGAGTGQLPEIPGHEHPQIKSYPDQATTQEQNTPQGLLTTRTQKFALIPSSGGQFTIPAIEIPWWNSQTDKMEIARIAAHTLSAKGVAAAAAPQPAAAGQQASPPGADDNALTSSGPGNGNTLFLSGLSAGLFILWLITLIAWLRARRPQQEPVKTDRPAAKPVTLNKAIQALTTACENQHATEVRDALLAWANSIWEDQPPRSLEAIAQRVDPVFSAELGKLSSHLYENPEARWDATTILQQAKKTAPVSRASDPVQEAELEPLYR